MSSFFVDDYVALKENRNLRGVVEQTWRDIDSTSSAHQMDFICHTGVSQDVQSRFHRSGELLPGHTVISFVEPHNGSALLHEDSLVLLDRSFSVGDVAKRQLSDVESGTVIRTSMECTLQPLYRYTGGKTLWPYKEKDSLLFNIPGEELRYLEDLTEDGCIIYKGWVGWIKNLYQEVTVRLEDGSIVVVQKPGDLEVQRPNRLDATTYADRQPKRNLSEILGLRLRAGPKEKTEAATVFYPSQSVTTKKANLRQGQYKWGYYKNSVSPKGIVVDVRDSQIIVAWMTQNVFDAPGRQSDMPSTILNIDEIDTGEIKKHTKRMPSSTDRKLPGAVQGSDIAVGDFVRFKDLPGASKKYTGRFSKQTGCQHGELHEISRTATMGYDMNVFMVKETRLKTTVQWQDGSISEQKASSLVPYLDVDGHDVWPGEIVVLKDNESENSSSDNLPPGDTQCYINPEQIGVVQSTDAKERIARVRWFANPMVSIFDDQRSVLLPGSTLGELSNRETEVSYYEIVAYPALNKERGDVVLIAPNSELLALHSTQALQLAAPKSYNIQATLDAVNSLIQRTTGGYASEGFANIHNHVFGNQQSQPEIDWLGEIVDLGLDGFLTVRLGALDNVRDIKVPVERLIVVPGPYDGSDIGSFSSLDEDDSDSDSKSSSGGDCDSEQVIEETVEYAGGMRLDSDDDDEMWSTDEDHGSPIPVSAGDRTYESMDIVTDNISTTDSTLPDNMDASNSIIDFKAQAMDTKKDINFESSNSVSLTEISSALQSSSYSNRPQQFVVLDTPPPPDHHFFKDSVQMSANLMRRIRKEHRILQSSLPDGVWVRSWERLDLLRVLIVGPRDTPYELAPFVMDFQFGQDFPNSPPKAYFHSWTKGLGKINPNLYEDGKICLSLLGTWDGSKNEEWSAERSSMLQVVVSLMGLVLVHQPYFSKPQISCSHV